jgi:hypothetical protein
MFVMKKIIYTIGILMFLSGPLHPWVSQAAEEDSKEQSCNVLEDPNCRVTARLEYALRGAGNKGLDWGQSFGATDPKDVGQNMYLMIYQKTQTNTLSDAIKATAAQYGLPPERMSLILGGNITPILERSPLMRQDEAVRIYNQMIATYNEKKDTLQLEASIKAKVEPNEMFADNDVDNSGFDLINDLNNLEIILFKKNDLVTFGGTYDGEDSGDEEATGSTTDPTTGGTTSPGEIPVDISGPPPSGSTTDEEGGDGDKPQNPFDQSDEDKSSVFAGGINPNQCFANQDLDKALDKFVDEAAKNDKLKSTYKPKDENTDGQDDGATTGTGGADIDVDVPIVDDTAADQEVPAAPPGDYSSPSLCDDIVCITLEFVKKPAEAAFSSSDNCIQCHVQFINEALKKTISHSLIPAKATGNLGESGLCKNASSTSLGSIGMNISINVVPVVTPPKDDLMTVGNIADEWNKFAAQNGAWNYNEKERRRLEAAKSGKTDPTPIMSDLERMLIVEIANAKDGQSIAESMSKASNSYNTQKQQEAQEMLVAEIAKEAYGEVDTLKALEDEMKQMNKYFDGFQKQIRTLLEDVPGLSSTKACVKLKEKKVCT